MMQPQTHKGFTFTFDAFIAITLAIVVIFLLISIVNQPTSLVPLQDQTFDAARDTLRSLEVLTVQNVRENGQVDKALMDQVSQLDNNNSMLIQLAKEELGGRHALADAIAQQLLETRVPPQFGIALQVLDSGANWLTIYNSTLAGRPGALYTGVQSSAQRVVLGYVTSPNPGAPYYNYQPTCVGTQTVCAPPVTVFKRGTFFGPTIIRALAWV